MEKTLLMGLVTTVLIVGVITTTTISNALAIGNPNDRGAADYAPGRIAIGNPDVRDASDLSPGHSGIGNPNDVAPGSEALDDGVIGPGVIRK